MIFSIKIYQKRIMEDYEGAIGLDARGSQVQTVRSI
jgi:hypothetical protein